jgi:hypothetical protein
MGVENDAIYHKQIDSVVRTETPGLKGDSQEPVTIFEQVTELQRQLDEAQAKIDRQRVANNARVQRWREPHRDHVRAYDRARKRAARSSKPLS